MNWMIFTLLVGALSFFIYKYNSSYQIILGAKESLQESEEELVKFKKNQWKMTKN